MDVKELLALLASMAIGLDDPTDTDITVMMRYLNLVYAEILRDNALINPVIKKTREVVNCTNGILEEMSQEILSVRAVYTTRDKLPLEATNLDAVLAKDITVSRTGIPDAWYYDSNVINIYPLYTGEVGVLYVPVPELLNVESRSYDIMIPTLFHSVLVDGTAYYLFQSEPGFKNGMKMKDAKDRWDKDKLKLATYLRNLSGQISYSTYSR